MDLPPLFLERMQRLLGDAYPAFQASFERPEPVGLRANLLKIDAETLRQKLPYPLEPIPWAPAGFVVGETPPGEAPMPGKHPYHAAGLYYLQEPSAMAAAAALPLAAPIQPGECVLDLCAAPGGKSTHLAALMAGAGLLVANETHPKRVWELAENLERWGAHNVVITSETPQRLAERLSGSFDRVLVDAPCSGEGMFRKSEAARRDWSPELVRSCAKRQSKILDEAARLVRPGGLLVYSTCTFNPNENEAVIAGLLERCPDYTTVSLAALPCGSPARPDWVSGIAPSGVPVQSAAPRQAAGLADAARIWPHLSIGTGHFVAALRREETAKNVNSLQRREPTKKIRRLDPAVPEALAEALFTAFWREHLASDPLQDLETGLILTGERLYALPAASPDFAGLRVIQPGWQLGAIQTGKAGGKRFEPAHALALGLRKAQARQTATFGAGDPRTAAYLHGEALAADGPDGWVLVCVDDYPLGWGKRVQHVIKNAYPKGLRTISR